MESIQNRVNENTTEKGYATEKNALRKIENVVNGRELAGVKTYAIQREADGRWFPVADIDRNADEDAQLYHMALAHNGVWVNDITDYATA